ncbi:hypothetical protein CKQ84_11715 [Shewanella sp. WE21]|nr:hypothetical protein CKQ84_11715 [Shewanella sp. WE21]
MAKRFILRLRLSTEHHYAFKPSPCLKRFELPLNEQIFNTIGIMRQVICLLIQSQSVSAFKILAQIKAAHCHDSEQLLTRWVKSVFGSEY